MWTPADHPRAAGGQFAPKGSGSSSSGGDGKTPAATTAQIKDFQKKYGLPVTGKFDTRTLAAFRAAQAPKGKAKAKKKAAPKPKHKKPVAKKASAGRSATSDVRGTAPSAKPGTKAPAKGSKATHRKPVAKKPVPKTAATKTPKAAKAPVRKTTIGGRSV